jgi:hypothetical protein
MMATYLRLREPLLSLLTTLLFSGVSSAQIPDWVPAIQQRDGQSSEEEARPLPSPDRRRRCHHTEGFGFASSSNRAPSESREGTR